VLAGLANSAIVAHAERDLVFHSMGVVAPPNDTFFSRQWGLRLSDFGGPWGKQHGARSVIVAVVDTGVDASQPDLAGVVLPGFNVITGTTDTSDQNGHGTAAAGVIAALANNGIGGAGVCSACLILPIKAMGANGTGDTAQVAAGIVKAANLGAKVINLSLGAPQSLDTLQQAVNYATAKGAVVLAAAGNSGVSTTFFPAGYSNVISVAGSNPSDRLYGWSNYGSWVSVAAPGCNVAPLIHGGYGLFCGTSSATPLVAGLVGLTLSVKRSARPAQVTKAIDQAAKRIHAKVEFGRIDAGAALARILGS
jgi:subtilisin family serine protease